MCAFYENGDKIKKGDIALYNNKSVRVLISKHIKENKTMDIVLEELETNKQYKINVPYKTYINTLKKSNTMGSEVEKGYECKPKTLDPNKPIMHYKNIIYICVDKRCSIAGSNKKADELRELLKSMDLDRGKDRIKISKSLCFGACRYKQVANIFSNTQANGNIKHNNIWLSATHKYNLKKWEELFLDLKNDKELNNFKQINMKVY